jgi:acetoin utilization deacetylase AcuC-like enzyme
LNALTLFYCDDREFPLPPHHKFPLAKYGLLRESLAGDSRFTLIRSRVAEREEVIRIHEQTYVDDFLQGRLPVQAMRRIGFPWSPELVTRTLASAGGTLLATQTAIETGFGGALAGGTHHAFRAEGSGFCVFNDIAVAIAWAKSHAGIDRFAVIDLDVHQGDGTASIFQGDASVFTLSIHGARNFPFRKQQSVLDIELSDGTTDHEYLETLAGALEPMWRSHPQLILFQAGVDALGTDRLGRLALTSHGLARRDRLVISQVHERRVPLVITIGGGYSEPISETVAAHAQTFRTAADVYCND